MDGNWMVNESVLILFGLAVYFSSGAMFIKFLLG